MHGFFSELGRRLAEKWVSLLVLPGLLYVGIAFVAVTCGHTHWADGNRVVRQVEALSGRIANRPVEALTLAALVLLLATSAALVARAAGVLAERAWLGDWRLPRLTDSLTERRQRRYHIAHTRFAEAVLDPAGSTPLELSTLAAARNRIALSVPSRPTWMGDRMAAVDARVYAAYRIDLESAWPRLWLILADPTRTELRLARTRFDDASNLAGWAALYALLGLCWWPAIPIALATSLTAWRRGRGAIAVFADLVEATVDVTGKDLAAALGIQAPDGRLTREVGEQITRILRKDA